MIRMPVVLCTNERKEFRKKIMDKRKQSIGKLGKKASKFIKTEIQETRTIIQDHIQYFRKNKNKKEPETVNVEVLDAEFFEK